ncbi:hypothetical protein JW698_03440 [Candidatus Wolfebacteria bacterium]|nr:hypothetical protein [Candidatus Wolfebacteria bacterium]
MNNNYWTYSGLILITKEENKKCLGYEISMFRETCKRIYLSKQEISFEKNLLIESLAIHTRTLVDFFYLDIKKNKNDIIAQDLLDNNKDWKKIRPQITQTLYDAKIKADKQLAHLSGWRVKIEKDRIKLWNVKEIENDIENIIVIFEKESGIKF